jgi:hypothetical protein
MPALWRVFMKKATIKGRTFKRPLFRINLYEQKENDFGGTISLTDKEHKTKRNLTRHLNSLDKIPRAMRKLLKKEKKADVKPKTTKRGSKKADIRAALTNTKSDLR